MRCVMTVEIIQAIGEYIIVPVAIAIVLFAWLK